MEWIWKKTAAGTLTCKILIVGFHGGMNTDFWFWGFCTVCKIPKTKNQQRASQSPSWKT
jgi:hypothetical protein